MSSAIRPRNRSVRHTVKPRVVRLEDRTTPTTSFYTPPSHFLTNPNLGIGDARLAAAPRLETALSFLRDHADELGLSPTDLTNTIVTSHYTDSDTGIAHLYLRQQVNGLPVANADFSVGIAANGSVVSAGGGFVAGLQSRLTGDSPGEAFLSAADAIRAAALGLDIDYAGDAKLVDPFLGPKTSAGDAYVLTAPSASLDDVTARLQYVPTADGSAALSWNLVLRTPDGDHWYDVSVNGATGELTYVADWIDDASYSALAVPVEHPLDGGFTLLNNPHDPVTSPYGWHDTNGFAGPEFTDTRGNNVDAHLDRNGDNVPDAGPPRPNGGAGLNFSGYSFNAALAPSTLQNENAAVVNLFYANNFLHDVHYKYGFTEAAGNFQTNNYGNGGSGNDAVQADAQDGSGTNNANFGTPVDGAAPRMQMFEFTSTSPRRDSSLDNGVIFHEYGHGVTNRLTGGPANSSALNNTQSGGMGEGWGDFYALMFTQRSSDQQNSGYPMGTYVLGQPANGAGIRRRQYSYNMTIDPLTFDAYGTSGTTSYGVTRSIEVHNSGELWCSALWDMNWLLINKYGFDQNLMTGWSPSPGPANAGNKLALRLVMEGLKLQPANPSFVQARDAIIAADIALNGGKDLNEIWQAFARRGLGQGAATASSNATTVTLSTTVPMLVASVNPATGSVVGSGPASYTLNVTAAVDPASLNASDFVVNGQPATGLSYSAGATSATFTFSSDPVTSDGPQTITIAAGAFNRASDTTAVAAYSSIFFVDGTPLSVTSVSPANAAVVPAPLTTVDVNLNQAVDPASVQAVDLTLSRGSVSGFTLLDGNMTVRFTIANAEFEGPLTLSLAAGAFLDTQGNPSSAFAGATYALDYDVAPFPMQFYARNPAGSLVYDGSFISTIGTAGDTDSFTIQLDAGQTLSVSVTPGSALQPSIALTGPGGSQSVTATGPGVAARLEATGQSQAGSVYTITFGGSLNTTGSYNVQLTLNSAPEQESAGGTDNNTLATAQDLAASLFNLGNGISVANVRGRTEVSGPALVGEFEPNGTTATATSAATYTSIPGNNLYQLGYSGTIGSSTDADYVNIGTFQVGDVLTISQSGSATGRGTNVNPLVRLYRAGATAIVVSDDDSGAGADALIQRYTIATADTYFVRAYRNTTTNTGTYQISVNLENAGTAPTTGGTFIAEVEPNESTGAANNASGAWRPLTHFATASGTITAGDTDMYAYSLTAGDVVTLTARSTSGLSPTAALLNSAGTAIANDPGNGVTAGAGGFATINAYVIPTTGTYYFRVTGASGTTGSYTAELNLSTTAALATVPLSQDLYAVNLAAGQFVTATVESNSVSNLSVAILDAAGAVALGGTTGATNFDQIAANFGAPAAGTYYVRISGAPGIDYDLTVVTGATFDAESNNTFATAQSLGASLGALGSINGNEDWYSISLTAGQTLVLSTATPGDATGEFRNALDPRIELYDAGSALVASDDNSAADGRNAVVTHTPTSSGTFRLRLTSVGGTAGEYTVKANIGTAAPRVTGVTVGDGSVQRSVVSSLTVTFDRTVALPPIVANAFTLSRDGGGAVTFQAFANIVGGVTVVTLNNFSGAETQFGSLADGRYTLIALNSQISAGGQALDGNGDGTPGDDYTFGDAQGLFRFYGDVSADRRIDITDFGPFSLTYNRATGDSGFNPVFDFNADGRIDIADFGQFSIRYFTDLP